MTGAEAMRLLDLAHMMEAAAAKLVVQPHHHRGTDYLDGMAGAFLACAHRLRQHVRDDVKVEP